MFSASIVLNQLPRLNYRNILRHHKKFIKRRHLGNDPGLGHRKPLVENTEEIEELADHEFDLEADFMNVGRSHVEHMKEAKLTKERQKYLSVRQKHFKETYPNFLTWSDKEQIRHLFRTDPEEWTIEKLSDGFPAVPEIIAKVATTNWSKKSDSAIHNHDESVKRNWKLFREGKVSDLPKDLAEHLKKFGARDLNIKPFTPTGPTEVNTKKSMLAPNVKVGNEFSNIITSYERLKNKNNNSNDSTPSKKHSIAKPPKEDTFMSKTNTYSTHITLDILKEKIQTKASHKKLSQDEQIMLQALKEDRKTEEKQLAEPNQLMSNANNSLEESVKKGSNLSVIIKDKKDYRHLEYPEQIKIPKRIFKPGFTYKLNDCYYDDDGEFLYRVPGMYK